MNGRSHMFRCNRQPEQGAQLSLRWQGGSAKMVPCEESLAKLLFKKQLVQKAAQNVTANSACSPCSSGMVMHWRWASSIAEAGVLPVGIVRRPHNLGGIDLQSSRARHFQVPAQRPLVNIWLSSQVRSGARADARAALAAATNKPLLHHRLVHTSSCCRNWRW